MARKIYIGKIPSTVADEKIHDLFSAVGKVVSMRLIKGSSDKNMNYGYVQMTSDDETRKAIRSLNNKLIEGSRLRVIEAHFSDQEQKVSYQWKKRTFRK